MTERTFGAPAGTPAPLTDVDLDAEAFETSPLDELRAELVAPVQRVTTARFWVDPEGRPGWWAEFDTGFKGSAMDAMQKRARPKGGEIDPVKLSILVIVETCTAIGKGDTTVFGGTDGLRPFKSGEIPKALKGSPGWESAREVAGGEAEWATAVRWIFGAVEDERPLLEMSGAIQRANATEVTRADGADPTP